MAAGGTRSIRFRFLVAIAPTLGLLGLIEAPLLSVVAGHRESGSSYWVLGAFLLWWIVVPVLIVLLALHVLGIASTVQLLRVPGRARTLGIFALAALVAAVLAIVRTWQFGDWSRM